MLECSHFDDIRAEYAGLLEDAAESMRNLMWHRDQKALVSLLFAISEQAEA